MRIYADVDLIYRGVCRLTFCNEAMYRNLFHQVRRQTHSWIARQVRDPYVIKSKLSGYRSRAAFKLLEIQEKHHVIKRGDVVIDLGCSPGGWSQVAAEFSGWKTRTNTGATPNNVSVEAVPMVEDAASNRKSNKTHVLDLLREDVLSKTVHSSEIVPNRAVHQVAEEIRTNVIGIDLLEMAPVPGVSFLHGDFLSASLQKSLYLSLAERKINVVLSDMAHSFHGNTALDATNQMQLAWAAWIFAVESLDNGGNFVVKVRYCDEYITFRNCMRSLFKRVIEFKPPASRAESAETYLVCLHIKPCRTVAADVQQLLQEHGLPKPNVLL